uniref:CHAT domain-containing protein n=1 Tax=Millisia brevis TaxID=264148 RepID=UPI0012EEB82D
GEAMAYAAHAKALSELGNREDPMQSFAAAVEALRRARVEVVDPGRRADHDFALRDVTTTLLTVGAAVGGAVAERACSNLLLDSAPLGLRADLTARSPGPAISDFISRVADLPRSRGIDTAVRRALLQQLSATVAVIGTHSRVPWFDFSDIRTNHPDHALLVIGAPQHDATLPLAWAVPTATGPSFVLVPLDQEVVDSLDGLGSAIGSDRSAPLWEELARQWQVQLTEVLLPAELQRWVMHPGGRLAVILPSVLAHLPIEALLIDDVPLGVRAAVSRIPAPNGAPLGPAQSMADINGYLDPAFSWAPEKAALGAEDAHCVGDVAQVPELLGTDTLTLVGCHGTADTRLDGALVSTAGERVLDAIDLLRRPLTDSVVVFESCYSGRYMGERTGEQLTLATSALIAGATAAVAGLFSLPADDHTTGIIVAALIRAVAGGEDAAEALRQAREIYWESRPERVRRPGGESDSMPSDAPWAWAGLVVFTS